MEFSQSIADIFTSLRDKDDYVVLDGAHLHKYTTNELDDFIDLLGEESMRIRKLAK